MKEQYDRHQKLVHMAAMTAFMMAGTMPTTYAGQAPSLGRYHRPKLTLTPTQQRKRQAARKARKARRRK